MGKKLVLHIGTGKAGSTSIQRFLKLLNQRTTGVDTIEAFGFPDAMKLVMSCRSPRARAYFVDRKKLVSVSEYDTICNTVFDEAASEINRRTSDVYVASSEHFYSLLGKEHISLLKERLDPLFQSIKIIVYLRDQRSFIRSLWAQSVNGVTRSTTSFEDFIESIDSQRHFWDYSVFLREWRQVFGVQSMNVTMFDPIALRHGNLIEDFVFKLGLRDLRFDAKHLEAKNVSPSWEELELIRQRNIELRAGPTKGLRFERQVQKWNLSYFNDLIVKKVSKGNSWVNEEFLSKCQMKLPT